MLGHENVHKFAPIDPKHGVVERFEVLNHPKAKHCNAWSDFDPKQEHITAVLELPPVKSALDAVKVYIVQQIKAGKGK